MRNILRKIWTPKAPALLLRGRSDIVLLDAAERGRLEKQRIRTRRTFLLGSAAIGAIAAMTPERAAAAYLPSTMPIPCSVSYFNNVGTGYGEITLTPTIPNVTAIPDGTRLEFQFNANGVNEAYQIKVGTIIPLTIFYGGNIGSYVTFGDMQLGCWMTIEWRTSYWVLVSSTITQRQAYFNDASTNIALSNTDNGLMFFGSNGNGQDIVSFAQDGSLRKNMIYGEAAFFLLNGMAFPVNIYTNGVFGQPLTPGKFWYIYTFTVGTEFSSTLSFRNPDDGIGTGHSGCPNLSPNGFYTAAGHPNERLVAKLYFPANGDMRFMGGGDTKLQYCVLGMGIIPCVLPSQSDMVSDTIAAPNTWQAASCSAGFVQSAPSFIPTPVVNTTFSCPSATATGKMKIRVTGIGIDTSAGPGVNPVTNVDFYWHDASPRSTYCAAAGKTSQMSDAYAISGSDGWWLFTPYIWSDVVGSTFLTDIYSPNSAQ